MPTLHWIGKEKVINHHMDVPFKVLEHSYGFDNGKQSKSETKGDYLDAEQKIRLGNRWANKAGNNYRYFLVYDKISIEGAYKLEDFLRLIKDL